MDDAKLMTTKEVAAYLDIAVSTLLLYRAEGTGPRYLKMGRLVRYRKAAVEEWLKTKE